MTISAISNHFRRASRAGNGGIVWLQEFVVFRRNMDTAVVILAELIHVYRLSIDDLREVSKLS